MKVHVFLFFISALNSTILLSANDLRLLCCCEENQREKNLYFVRCNRPERIEHSAGGNRPISGRPRENHAVSRYRLEGEAQKVAGTGKIGKSSHRLYLCQKGNARVCERVLREEQYLSSRHSRSADHQPLLLSSK